MASPRFAKWMQGLTVIALIALAALGASMVLLPLEQAIFVAAITIVLLSVLLVCWWQEIMFDELVLLFLVGGTVALDRTFSYWALVIQGVPLYVTELSMALLALVIVGRNIGHGRFRSTQTVRLDYAILAYLLIGSIILLRTLGTYGVEAIKDFAIIYYAAIFFMVVEIVQSPAQLRRLGFIFLGGATIALGLGVFNIVTGAGLLMPYGVIRYLAGQAGMYLVITAILLICLRQVGHSQVWVALALLACAVGIFLSEQRSVWLAFAGALGLIVALDWKGELVPRALILRFLVAIGVFLLVILLLTPFQSQAAQAIENSTTRLVTGLVDPQSDPTASWRLAGWEEGINTFFADPIAGTGFGVTFDWYAGRTRVENRPHNTYLTILIKAGLMGLLPFLLSVGAFYLYAWRAFQRATHSNHKAILLALLAAHVSLSIFGLFNLLLESPYLAIFYWGIMGVLVAVEQRQLVKE